MFQVFLGMGVCGVFFCLHSLPLLRLAKKRKFPDIPSKKRRTLEQK